ncbi:hypothetical protein NUW58_g9170 [Xylaria curta]|uniref:Uncharacterized protein n=1 Tax=Xylaria curta TaxID=42375 RepID=A0ACC1MZR5_9PEZI|nr:hypothetical protein NUW58_g9170 [Xylaria curta]
MKVKIKKWNAVATWRWDLPEDDVCGICQVHFDGTCPTCKYPGDDCSLCKLELPVIWFTCVWEVWSQFPHGQCLARLFFSLDTYRSPKLTATKHCIMEWIKQDSAKGQCPMCRQKFEWNEPGGGQQQHSQPEIHEDNDGPPEPL